MAAGTAPRTVRAMTEPTPEVTAPAQAHVLMSLPEGAAPAVNLWPRLVRAIWREVPAATTVLRPGALAVIAEGHQAIDVLEQRVLPLAVAQSHGAVRVAGSWVVTDPRADQYANLDVMRMLDNLAAAELSGALGSWRHRGTARQAALHLVNPLAWLERAGELCSAALGEVAAMEDFTAEDVVSWTSEFTQDQEWWLMAPLVADALTRGSLAAAFDEGETIEVGLVSDAVIGVASSALTKVAHIRQRPARLILDDLLSSADG